MDARNLNAIEIDAIGEILNISFGAASTAVSKMLDIKADITIPSVRMQEKGDSEYLGIEPAVAVEIEHDEGLFGKNVMILKSDDARKIVGLLMGMEIPPEEFSFDELTMSAVGEVMNQMMGASATVLSELLEMVVNISPPAVSPVEKPGELLNRYYDEAVPKVEIEFTMTLGDEVACTMMYLLPVDLAKDVVSKFYEKNMPEASSMEEIVKEESAMSQVSTDNEVASVVEPVVSAPEPVVAPQPVMEAQPVVAPQPIATPQPVVAAQPVAPVQPAVSSDINNTLAQMMELMKVQMEMTQNQMMQMSNQKQENKKIRSTSAVGASLKQTAVDTESDANLDLVMGVPVEVSVEIGRTKKLVKEVLELNKGSLVVLDKLTGEHIDLYVNGQCIAQGDVVVVDDNFGIRITEILSRDIPMID